MPHVTCAVVDLTIRSPEATPWRRKPPKSQLATDTQSAAPTSTDNKVDHIGTSGMLGSHPHHSHQHQSHASHAWPVITLSLRISLAVASS